MLFFKKWILAPAMVLGTMAATDTNQAKADFGIFAGRGISISIGGGYPGYRSLYAPTYRSVYGHGYASPYRSYYSRGHYDYHPQEIVPHGNHFHMIPGHYDYYPNGHRGHGGHHGHH